MQNSLFYRKKPTKHSAGNLTNYLKREPKTRYANENILRAQYLGMLAYAALSVIAR